MIIKHQNYQKMKSFQMPIAFYLMIDSEMIVKFQSLP